MNTITEWTPETPPRLTALPDLEFATTQTAVFSCPLEWLVAYAGARSPLAPNYFLRPVKRSLIAEFLEEYPDALYLRSLPKPSYSYRNLPLYVARRGNELLVLYLASFKSDGSGYTACQWDLQVELREGASAEAFWALLSAPE